MHISLVPLLSLLAGALAQLQNGPNAFNNPVGFSLTAGTPTTITWKPSTPGTVTLKLRSGANSDLEEGTVIKANIPNSGSFTYTPPSDTVRNSDYTIEIVSDDDPSKVNYTPQFVIESKNTVVSITSSASSASSASSVSSVASSSASSVASSARSASSASSVTSAASSASSASSISSSASSAASKSASSSGSSRSSASVASSSASSAASQPSAAVTTSAPTTAPTSNAAPAHARMPALLGVALGFAALF